MSEKSDVFANLDRNRMCEGLLLATFPLFASALVELCGSQLLNMFCP
jgi:hypothetical protein